MRPHPFPRPFGRTLPVALTAVLAAGVALSAAPLNAVVRPRGPERTASDPAGRQRKPAVLLVPSGSVLAWEEEGVGVVARRFDAEGAPVGPARLIAAADPIPPLPFARVPLREHLEPALAGRGDDTFLLAHTEQLIERSADYFFEERLLLGSRVMARLYRADGAPMARPVDLADGDSTASRPALASAEHGFWAAWQQGGFTPGVFVRKLNPRGQPLAPPVRVSVGGEDVALASAGGRTLVVWVSNGEFRARMLGAEAQPLGEPFLLTTRRARVGSTAAVAVQPGGDFLVVVQRSSHVNARVYGQRVSRAGERVGGTLLLNAATGDRYTAPQVVPLPGSRWLVAWVTWVGNFRVAVEYAVFDPALAATERGLLNERPIASLAEVALAASGERIAAAWEGYAESNVRALRVRAFVDEPPPPRPRRRRR